MSFSSWCRKMFLTRGQLPISSFLCFIGGFSMGSFLVTLHQLQLERTGAEDLSFLPALHQHRPVKENLLLLGVLIISAPGNVDRRNTLRETWLKLNPNKALIRHFFLVGTQGLSAVELDRLRREEDVEEDLLLLHELQDSYANLTLKVAQGLGLMGSFKYVLKCDDDSFVRLDSMGKELSHRETIERPEQHCTYWGYFDGRARVQRGGKWMETEYNICDLYVPYALGGGYVLSKKCVDFIARNTEMLRLFKNEDVSVGTWLAGVVNDKRHDIRFDTEYESRGCNNAHLVQHKISLVDMVERYKHILKTGTLCPKESRHRPYYEYQWNGPPSQCCKREVSNPA